MSDCSGLELSSGYDLCVHKRLLEKENVVPRSRVHSAWEQQEPPTPATLGVTLEDSQKERGLQAGDEHWAIRAKSVAFVFGVLCGHGLAGILAQVPGSLRSFRLPPQRLVPSTQEKCFLCQRWGNRGTVCLVPP